jgi:aspartate racemase
MKTIGLLGGMSWESTVSYYTLLNRMTRQRLGGLHSAKILLYSFNFAEIEALQNQGDWHRATELMVAAAENLESAGADCLLIGTNTMHRMADEVASALTIPLLHIADVTAQAVNERGARAPLLLATKYTMEEAFYRDRLRKNGVTALIPQRLDRESVHRVIYDELCQGLVLPASKRAYLDIVARAIELGADSVILGCTEVALLVAASDFNVPTFDTTSLHAQAAIEFALG